MKKLVFIAIAFIGLQATAQQEREQGSNRCERNDMMKNLSAEDMATLQTKKMTLALDLNESQQKDAYNIHLENAKKCKAHIAEMKAKKESGTFTKTTPEDKFKMMNAMLDRKIETKAKMKTILDKEQFKKWEKVQARIHGEKKNDKRKMKCDREEH